MYTPNPSSVLWYEDQMFSNLQAFIESEKPDKIFFLVDENTHDHCLPALLADLGDLPATEVLEVPAGEEAKSPEVLLQLWGALSELGADRRSLMINLGGGVVTDLGAFLAGTYMRGIAFINIPTSLLAMVDASTGGKCGINLGGLKNQVGLFLEPAAVAVHPMFLDTLPKRERISGFAEMLKHGLIADHQYWEELSDLAIEEHRPTLEQIQFSIGIKKSVVERDFREAGLRKILNFGHTIGHALESLSLQTAEPLLHGEAVALGMFAETYLSEQHAGLESDKASQVYKVLRTHFRCPVPQFDQEQVLRLIQADKKNDSNRLLFSLLNTIGHASPNVELTPAKVREALNFLRVHFNG